MGRGYIVEDGVETYLSGLCASGATRVAGLLIGQSTAQRDFVVMATQTPQREESTPVAGSSLSKQDLEWTTEHARQVSRMLPGGLYVLGVFMITDVDAKDTLNTLRQLVFGIENLISRGHLWSLADDDVTDRVTLHINSKTRKTVCRTFDVKDPKSTAKPADWKYQSGICASWPVVSCSLRVELLVPIPENRTSLEDVEKCLKEGLKTWTQQIESGVCLINGKRLPDDTELSSGQKKNVKQILKIQLLTTPSCQNEQRTTAVVQQCGGSVSVSGAVHARAYLHSNKPKAKLAEKLLKRDVVSTVAVRVQMLLEELLTAEEDNKARSKEYFALPRRVFCPIGGAGPVCVCDYQFGDEDLAEVTDRLKETLDIEAAEQDLDVTLETAGDITETSEVYSEPIVAEKSLEPKKINYTGIAVASAVAMLATAASLLYLDY